PAAGVPSPRSPPGPAHLPFPPSPAAPSLVARSSLLSPVAAGALWLAGLPRRANICRMVQDPSLTEDEHLVLRLHPHWKTLIGPLSVAVLVVVAVLIAEVLIPSGSVSTVIRLVLAAVAILALMLWLIVPVLRWPTTNYALN